MFRLDVLGFLVVIKHPEQVVVIDPRGVRRHVQSAVPIPRDDLARVVVLLKKL